MSPAIRNNSKYKRESSMSSGNKLNGAQVIVDYLIQEKVPQVFGLCGHGNIQFIDALYERSSDIKTISVHHESVAGFMADVYYRVSAGRPRRSPRAAPARPTCRSRSAMHFSTRYRSWPLPATCRPASSIAARSRNYIGTIKPTFHQLCGLTAKKCSSRRAVRWCRWPSARPGRR